MTLTLDLEAGLVEASVLAAAGARAPELDREREPLYEVADPEAREEAFAALHRRWFGALALGRPLLALLAEQPSLEAEIARGTVVTARRASDEGAELFVREGAGVPPAERRLVVRLRARTLVNVSALAPLLRRELLHVADMLDPSFGYRPALPPAEAGPSEDRVVQGRYGAAWGVTVVGRLVRRGLLEPGARDLALARFAASFPEGVTSAAFDQLFLADRPTHAELVALARSLGASTRCRLCAMPTWTVSRAGVCPQCAELVRARAHEADPAP